MDSFAPHKLKEYFPKNVSLDQAKDTGMAMVLIGLLVALITRQRLYIGLSVLLLLVDMVWPRAYRPLGKVWFGFSRLLGAVMSRLLFGLIFFIMVVPVGLVRRLLGKDSLQMRKWKTGRGSVLRKRDHEYAAEDIANPY
jgi:hypothetical protein